MIPRSSFPCSILPAAACLPNLPALPGGRQAALTIDRDARRLILRGEIDEDAPGAVHPSELIRTIESALEQSPHLVLDIDSPGGSTKGVAEAAAFIRETVRAGADITAHTSGELCSAAYWLAVPCRRITATRGAIVGNVGVWALFQEFSEADRAAGIRTALLTSGELKTAGHPALPLTPAQLAFLSAQVQAMAELFFDDVFTARPTIHADAVRSGRYCLAREALKLGFIDAIVQPMPKA